MENHKTPQALLEEITRTCGGGNYIFRGETSLYKLPVSSTIYRKYGVGKGRNLFNSHYQPVHIEEERVERAKKAQFTHKTANAEALTVLRHFGADTTLIDFSHDLFIALFFACNDEHDKDGCVYALDTSSVQTLEDIDYEKRKNNLDIALLNPIRTSLSQARTQAQSSVFVHAPRGKVVKGDGLLCFYVPRLLKLECLKYLKRFHAISADTIYNDLIGFIDNERNFDSTQHFIYSGNANVERADYQAAIEDFSQATELNPNDPDGWYGRGNAKRGLRQYEEAIKDYNKAIELNPNDPDAWINRGIAKDNLGQHKEAIKDYNKAIELNSNDPDTWNNLGIAKNNLGQHEEAIKDYNKAIELNHNDPYAWYNRGNAKAKLCQYKEAIKDYNKAIELNPDHQIAWINRGNAKDNLGQHKEAIKDYNKAIELNPNDPYAWYNRGNAKARLDQHEEAIKDYNKAIELNPDYQNAWNNRGKAKAELSQHKEAIKDLGKASELNPNYPLTSVTHEMTKATPLAERVNWVPDIERLRVTPMPMDNTSLYETVSHKLRDALADIRADQTLDNARYALDETMKMLDRTLATYADSPQRVHDDMALALSEVRSLLANDEIPDYHGVKRFMQVLEINALDIQANVRKVMEAVERRTALRMRGLPEADRHTLKEATASAVPYIENPAIQTDMREDAEALDNPDPHSEHGKHHLYRLVSRTSRFFRESGFIDKTAKDVAVPTVVRLLAKLLGL